MDADHLSRPALLESEWKKFCLACFGNVGPQQYIDLRRTFYGGASALFFLMMTKFEAVETPTEADLQTMRDLHNEIREFNEAVKAGKA